MCLWLIIAFFKVIDGSNLKLLKKVTPSSDLVDGRTCNPSDDKLLSLRRRSMPQLDCYGRQNLGKWSITCFMGCKNWTLSTLKSSFCFDFYNNVCAMIWICLKHVWMKKICHQYLTQKTLNVHPSSNSINDFHWTMFSEWCVWGNLSRIAIWGGGCAWQHSSASVHRPVSLQSQNYHKYNHSELQNVTDITNGGYIRVKIRRLG